jgi:hypothetical protein
MAVQEQTPYIEHIANGVTTSFTLGFVCDSADNLVVTINDLPTNVGDWSFSDGNVVFQYPPLLDSLIKIWRNSPLARSTTFKTYDNSLNPNSLNFDLDKIWLVMQELNVKNSFSDIKLQELLDALVEGNINGLPAEVLARIAGDESTKSLVNLEAIRAYQAESNLSDRIDNESLIADQNILAEKHRAEAVEQNLLIQVNSVGVGNKAYKTYALMDADKANIPAKSKVTVTNDATASNNGDWQWDGSTFTKSTYDPIVQAKVYTDSLNKNKNLLRLSLVNFTENPISSNVFVTFQKSANQLQINCAANSGIIHAAWRAYAAEVGASTVSALITLSADAGTSGNIYLKQYDANNTLLSTSNMSGSLAGAISNQTFSVANIALASGAKFIEVELNLGDSTNKTRKAYIGSVAIVAGATAELKTSLGEFYPKVNIFPSPGLSKEKATLYEATLSGGELLFEGTAIKQAWYDQTINDLIQIGSYVAFELDVYATAVAAIDVTLQCFDSSNTQLNTNVVIANTKINEYERIATRAIVPANTAYVRFRIVKRATASLAKVKSPLATSSEAIRSVVIDAFKDGSGSAIGFNTIYVTKTGSDTNNGKSKTNAVATVAQAVKLASPVGRIIIEEGDYTFGSGGVASWAGVTQLSIEAERNARVRFISETKVTGISKTAGYTKVYQGTLLGTGWNPSRCDWIWHHDVPDPRTLIPAFERVALQRGRSHRLNSTKIEKVDSIAEIEAATTPKWYHDLANNTLYFSIWNGADATAADIRIPSSLYAPFYGGTGTERIKLVGIDVLYSGANGFAAQRLISFEAENCRSLFNGDNGGAYDDCKFVQTKFCEYGGNYWDGGNIHCAQANTYQMPIVYQAIDTWSHDNRDDGDSMHEICLGTYWGGLYEYNGDRGIATSYGAHGTAYNTYARYNGQIDLLGGEGFAALGQLTIDTGVGTQMDCFNCVSIGNRYNYMASVSSSTVNAYGCTSRDATAVGYRGDSGIVNAYDCKTFNDATVKSGNVNVINSNSLV